MPELNRKLIKVHEVRVGDSIDGIYDTDGVVSGATRLREAVVEEIKRGDKNTTFETTAGRIILRRKYVEGNDDVMVYVIRSERTAEEQAHHDHLRQHEMFSRAIEKARKNERRVRRELREISREGRVDLVVRHVNDLIEAEVHNTLWERVLLRSGMGQTLVGEGEKGRKRYLTLRESYVSVCRSELEDLLRKGGRGWGGHYLIQGQKDAEEEAVRKWIDDGRWELLIPLHEVLGEGVR